MAFFQRAPREEHRKGKHLPLRSGETWAKDPASKASLLASTFASKGRLPDQVVNEYTFIRPSRNCLRRFLRMRDRDILKILMNLDVTSATGPDALPALILKRCASELALPIAVLARLCLGCWRWLSCWRRRWTHPLRKRPAKSRHRNSGEIGFTAQL